MTRRTERVGHVIQRELSEYILREISDPRIGFLTLSRVDVTPDLGHAKVLVSVLGSDAEKQSTLSALIHYAPRMRTHLSKVLQTRTVPRLQFDVDKNLDHGFRIAALLKEIKAEEKPAGGNAQGEGS